MLIQTTIRPIRPTSSEAAASDRRGIRIPQGADTKLFGGWGVRF